MLVNMSSISYAVCILSHKCALPRSRIHCFETSPWLGSFPVSLQHSSATLDGIQDLRSPCTLFPNGLTLFGMVWHIGSWFWNPCTIRPLHSSHSGSSMTRKTHTYVHIYKYVYIYMYTHVHVYTCTYMHSYIHTSPAKPPSPDLTNRVCFFL